MNIRNGLVAGRSHIIFVLALLAAFGLIYWLDQAAIGLRGLSDQHETDRVVSAADPVAIAAPGDLDPVSMQAARLAWQYFVNNTNADTGLVNATDNYLSTTMWDTGSYLLGLIAAKRLGIVEQADFDQRMTKALASLAKLALFDNVLPNKAYNVATLEIVDYDNSPSSRGLGWSALDIARLTVALQAISRFYPEHAAEVSDVLASWDMTKLVADGYLQGSSVSQDGKTILTQEGRAGYEQYGAKALAMLGLDVGKATRVETFVTYHRVEDIPIPVDTRLVGNASPAFATSEPLVLDGLEFGFDAISHALASNVYRAQESRANSTGHLTAVSEGHISKAPYFGYSTVWGNGASWAVMSLNGDRFDNLRTLSTKTAFGWNALFRTEYSSKLASAVADLSDPQKGWGEGRYEIDGSPNAVFTGNTNAIILESIAFIRLGPLFGAHIPRTAQTSPN